VLTGTEKKTEKKLSDGAEWKQYSHRYRGQ